MHIYKTFPKIIIRYILFGFRLFALYYTHTHTHTYIYIYTYTYYST